MDFLAACGFDLTPLVGTLTKLCLGYPGDSQRLSEVGPFSLFFSDPTRVNTVPADPGQAAGQPLYVFDGQFSIGTTFFHGLIANDSLRARIDNLLDAPSELSSVNAGVFVAGRVTAARLQLIVDPLGQYPLYYAALDDRFVVSNLVQLVAAVLQSAGHPVTPSLLPCLEGMVMGGCLGTATHYAEIERLPFGSSLVAQPRLSVVRTSLPEPDGSYADMIRHGSAALTRHVSAVAEAIEQPRLVVTDLTGGSDTRAVLSFLLGSPLRSELTGRCFTRLPNPDANVAGSLMAQYGIPVGTMPTVVDSFRPLTELDRQRRSIVSNAAFSGGARVPEGPLPSVAFPHVVHFTGSFGELGGSVTGGDLVGNADAHGWAIADAVDALITRRRRVGALDLITEDGLRLVRDKAITALRALVEEGVALDQIQAELYLRTRCRDHFGMGCRIANQVRIRPDPLASQWLVAARRRLPRALHLQNKVILDLTLSAGAEGRELSLLPMADKRWGPRVVPPEDAPSYAEVAIVTAATPALSPNTAALMSFAPIGSAALRQMLTAPERWKEFVQLRREFLAKPRPGPQSVRFGNEGTITMNQELMTGILDRIPRDDDVWHLLDRDAVYRYATRPPAEFNSTIDTGAFSHTLSGLMWMLDRPRPDGVKNTHDFPASTRTTDAAARR